MTHTENAGAEEANKKYTTKEKKYYLWVIVL